MSIEKDSAYIPDYVYSFYLSDLIEVALILQKQVENLTVPVSALIEVAKRLPMNIQGVIAIAYRKTILKEATEVIISALTDQKGGELTMATVIDPQTGKYIHLLNKDFQ